MLSVSTALERLRDCLSDDFPPSSGTRIFDIPFPLHDAFDPLLWCDHQAQWPQFYWLQRNGDEELAALGVDRRLLVLGRGPFGVSGHANLVSMLRLRGACRRSVEATKRVANG